MKSFISLFVAPRRRGSMPSASLMPAYFVVPLRGPKSVQKRTEESIWTAGKKGFRTMRHVFHVYNSTRTWIGRFDMSSEKRGMFNCDVLEGNWNTINLCNSFVHRTWTHTSATNPLISSPLISGERGRPRSPSSPDRSLGGGRQGALGSY